MAPKCKRYGAGKRNCKNVSFKSRRMALKFFKMFSLKFVKYFFKSCRIFFYSFTRKKKGKKQTNKKQTKNIHVNFFQTNNSFIKNLLLY